MNIRTADSKEWGTPKKLFRELNYEFKFDLDACASDENFKCEPYFTKRDNALRQDWTQWLTVWMNPPYGRSIDKWVHKAYLTSQQGTTVVCLLPSKTDTRWFHDYCLKAEVRFIKGRLKFQGAPFSAPFPSMVVVFRGVV